MTTAKAFAISLLLASTTLGLVGCTEDCIECVDNVPPAVPTGVFSVTGDSCITIHWNDLDESDLAGYAVYRDDNADGEFEHLADLARNENLDLVTGLHWYVDRDAAGHPVRNGSSYEYAVAAFDRAGNESDLSHEIVVDTPRPEGFGIVLSDALTNPVVAGFDFFVSVGPPRILGQRVDAASDAADFLARWDGSVPFAASARPDVVLQDYGNVGSNGFVDLDLLSYAPEDGWSRTGLAELIPGHAYVVRIGAAPYNFAKFAVTGVDVDLRTVTIDWAYQLVPGSRELKAPAAPRPAAGDGLQLISF